MISKFGVDKISLLILRQAIPSSIGILAMSLNLIIDTIFVGRWVDLLAIGALTTTLPIVFFISSAGMGIGIGGSSIISRALGNKDKYKVNKVFENQLFLTFCIAFLSLFIGVLFPTPLLKLFGAKEAIEVLAKEYFGIVIYGVPFFTFAMMGNPIIRALGKPKYAMAVIIFPVFINIILDILFIKIGNLGMFGAGLATTCSFLVSGILVFYFFLSKKQQTTIYLKKISIVPSLIKEIMSLGSVTFVRQGTISLLIIILNYNLLKYGSAISISIYGIINRVMMFALFPVLGITQGFLPVAGYNYGAKDLKRVKETIRISLIFGTGIALIIFILIMFFNNTLIGIFTNNKCMIKVTSKALTTTFLATPLITIQLIGSAYFQVIGETLKALLLALLKQGFFLIPLIYILPKFYGINGIWVSFPIADILSTIITLFVLKHEIKTNL
ncbi:MATE family efflux transporter [Tenacibaculum sp. C7A-26P2]|uniref:MATE family efflux transporter n=1 Tax=Tenacibaculum sp. C7A-26P2 TaxID=3447504 RepID=UPI003F877111